MSARKILVVEDETAIRDMLVFSLGRAGYEVLGAGTAQEARSAIANSHPDVILMDWMLPDVSGLELTRQLKREPETREIPVIMVTAKGRPEDMAMARSLGAVEYITKPWAEGDVELRVDWALATTQAS